MNNATLRAVRELNKETNVGQLFCYKALKRFDNDYQLALEYLKSDEFKNSVHTKYSLHNY